MESIFTDPIFEKIRNRSTDEILDVLDEINNYWIFSLDKRKPNVIFEEDGTAVTTLDLLTFLYSLEDRGAVIKIPNYRSLRPTVSPAKKGEMIVSKDRFGKIIELRSNMNTFNFSIMIKDAAVIDSESVGKPRLFTITDFDGEWFGGWDRLDFIPDAVENKYILENFLVNDDKSITFDKFISSSRWVSFFSKHYILTKYAIQMLKERSKFYNKLLKEMKNSGKIKFPNLSPPDVAEFDEDQNDVNIKKDPGKKTKVIHFNVEVDLPENDTKFDEDIKFNLKEYNRIYELRKKVNRFVAKLQVMTRAAEYGHWKNQTAKPSWIKVNWEDNYKTTEKSRTIWNRLVLINKKNMFVAIRKREFEKYEEVSSKY